MAKWTCLVLGLMTALLLPADPATAQPAGQSAPGAVPGTAGGDSEISPKEKELLERIRRMKAPRWRSFGVCRYDWSAWRLSEGGVRSTDVECGTPPVKGTVAVHCDTLRVTRRAEDGSWKPWRLPLSMDESAEMGGEDVMVASLCANLRPVPATSRPPARPTTPPSPATGTAKPAATTQPKTP